MIRNGAAHCPTNSAQSSFFKIFNIADAAMEPIANPKNALDGNFDVWLSIIPV